MWKQSYHVGQNVLREDMSVAEIIKMFITYTDL